jgi:Pyridine nucleotide-disulphide oxidoreductase
MMRCDVAILGAGPYGLSAAAHLRTVPGLEVRVFGKPMSFWQCNMPKGMFLRSNWTATQIADPAQSLTLEAYQAESGAHFSKPVPLECFVAYGRWYQRQSLPDLDQRDISRIEKVSSGFQITLSDGAILHSRRIVIAAGIRSFAWTPPEFDNLHSSLASHASDHHSFSRFAGRQVLVIGSGQSALESAALLHEASAQVEVIARAKHINWLQGWASTTLHGRLGSGVRNFLYAPTDVGPAGISQLMARPDLLRKLPRGLQDKLRKRAVRPAGARWLVNRLKAVPIQLGRHVTSVATVGNRAKVGLDDGSERTVDHVLLGTGYRVDISKYDFLDEGLKNSISRSNGYPQLREGLETSVDGLHILGAPAAWSFGPLMQFVSGTHYASRVLVGCIAGKAGKGY